MNVALGLIGLLGLAGPSSTGATADQPRFFHYLVGNQVSRLAFPNLRPQTLFEIPASAIGRDSIIAAAGSVAWLSRAGPAESIITWSGQARGAVPLEKQASANGYSIEQDEHGEISHVVPAAMEYRFLSEFLLSPDGKRVAWNVNVTTGYSPEQEGTEHERHLIFVSDIDGLEWRLVLQQDYSVPYCFADASEQRHLFQWSRISPDQIYYTRYEGAQLGGREVGLYTCGTRSGTADSLTSLVEHVLALSEDEKQVAHSSNDETCCGGINYTDNLVLVKSLTSGENIVVFDEWEEFGNRPSRSDDPHVGEDYIPEKACFSPDGKRIAITIGKWVNSDDRSPDRMTVIRDVRPGIRGGLLQDRTVLGWIDNGRVLLGRCQSSEGQPEVAEAIYVYQLDQRREIALPLKHVIPIGVGP